MESVKQKVPQIKICGITQNEEIRWLNEAGISYAGFVLYEKSSRYVSINKIQELFKKLNDNIKKKATTHINKCLCSNIESEDAAVSLLLKGVKKILSVKIVMLYQKAVLLLLKNYPRIMG